MKIWFDTEFIEDGRTIELISIGMVREDGATYYAETDQYRPGKASQWVKDNVLVHLKGGVAIKPLDVIGREIIDFAGDDPEFWAYYADYDWVALCQLFGTMMQLPSGWPMFCRDVKQLCVSLGDPELPSQTSVEHHALNDAKWTKTAWEFLQSYPQCVASAEATPDSEDDRDTIEVVIDCCNGQMGRDAAIEVISELRLAGFEIVSASRSPAVGGKKLHKSMWQQPEYDPELSLLGAVKEMAASQDGPEYQSQPESDWRAPAATWLRHKADIAMNSLHCGDGAGEIAATRRYANVLSSVADELSAKTTEEPRG